jgi:hypothetical protein
MGQVLSGIIPFFSAVSTIPPVLHTHSFITDAVWSWQLALICLDKMLEGSKLQWVICRCGIPVVFSIINRNIYIILQSNTTYIM